MGGGSRHQPISCSVGFVVMRTADELMGSSSTPTPPTGRLVGKGEGKNTTTTNYSAATQTTVNQQLLANIVGSLVALLCFSCCLAVFSCFLDVYSCGFGWPLRIAITNRDQVMVVVFVLGVAHWWCWWW